MTEAEAILTLRFVAVTSMALIVLFLVQFAMWMKR